MVRSTAGEAYWIMICKQAFVGSTFAGRFLVLGEFRLVTRNAPMSAALDE